MRRMTALIFALDQQSLSSRCRGCRSDLIYLGFPYLWCGCILMIAFFHFAPMTDSSRALTASARGSALSRNTGQLPIVSASLNSVGSAFLPGSQQDYSSSATTAHDFQFAARRQTWFAFSYRIFLFAWLLFFWVAAGSTCSCYYFDVSAPSQITATATFAKSGTDDCSSQPASPSWYGCFRPSLVFSSNDPPEMTEGSSQPGLLLSVCWHLLKLSIFPFSAACFRRYSHTF